MNTARFQGKYPEIYFYNRSDGELGKGFVLETYVNASSKVVAVATEYYLDVIYLNHLDTNESEELVMKGKRSFEKIE
jgi:hypothetical protein